MALLKVNGLSGRGERDARHALPRVLRDHLGLTGTKFGCGIGQCGACTVHLDGNPVRSCVLPIFAVKGEITTIEAVGESAAGKHVQAAWLSLEVVQCGFSRARSCRPKRCLPAFRVRTIRISMPRCPASCAGARVSAYSCCYQGSKMRTYGVMREEALPDVARRRFLTAGARFAFFRPARAFEREPDLAAVGALDVAATGFDGFVPDGFIRIGVDGRVVLVVLSVEMGQGIATGEAMIIADESAPVSETPHSTLL